MPARAALFSFEIRREALVLAHRWSNSWWWVAVAVVVLAVAVWLTIGSGHDDKLDVPKVSTATNYGTWKPVPDQSLTSG